MIINIMKKLNSSVKAEVIVKAAVASDALSAGKAAVGRDLQTNRTVLNVGLCKWVDGEHGEEEALRRCCRSVTDYAEKSGYQNIVIDTASFSEYYAGISYITNILLEEFSGISATDKPEGLTVTLLIPENDRAENLNEELEDELSKPVIETVNHLYGDKNDPLKEEFREFQKKLGEEKTFREYLVDLMHKKGIRKNTDVYKPSGISKYTFSRITNFSIEPPHKPAKETVAALTIGLKLNLEEAEELYSIAGYSLGKREFIDKVIRFFIYKRLYDIDQVNYCLAHHGYPLLGERMRGENVNVIID